MTNNTHRVLITGGRGVLGRELTPRLLQAGYTVRITSRRPAPSARDTAVEWAQADLENDSGLAEALQGVHTLIHAASSPFRHTRQVDVVGTGQLLKHAQAAGVAHFVYISIVGIDRVPYWYYRHKLAAEQVIEQSAVPWSILRATQFHSLIDMFCSAAARLPVMGLPLDIPFQPIDAGEVAARLVESVAQGPAGFLPDIGGPEVRRVDDLARVWLAARGLRRPLVRFPFPFFGKTAAAMRQGWHTTPENRYGRIMWEEWLAGRYRATRQGE